MTQTDIFNGEILKNPTIFFAGRGLLPPPILFGQPSTFDYKKCFVYKEKKRTAFALFLVGLSGLEPPTPTLSGWCSNRLSYNPLSCSSFGKVWWRQAGSNR